jgi:hypothetical protein
VYDVPRRAEGHHFIIAYLAGKARDGVMVLVTVAILTINGFLTTGLQIVRLVQERLQRAGPGVGFLASEFGQVLSELLAFGFAVALFYVVYRHASPRRLRRRAAVVGSIFTAIWWSSRSAVRLVSGHLAMTSQFSTDAQLGALVLFVLWVYYAALVFLLGAVVAETPGTVVAARSHRSAPHRWPRRMVCCAANRGRSVLRVADAVPRVTCGVMGPRSGARSPRGLQRGEAPEPRAGARSTAP